MHDATSADEAGLSSSSIDCREPMGDTSEMPDPKDQGLDLAREAESGPSTDNVTPPQTSHIGWGSKLGKPARPNDDTVVKRRAPFGEPKPESIRAPVDAKKLVGKVLQHYALDELIGYGGMGVVFRATDIRLNRTVAIKVLTYREGKNEEIIRRFQQEAQSAAQLGHENIAQVYDVGESDGWNFIAFEFVDGPNIRDMVFNDGPLTVNAAIGFVIQTAEALKHASDRDIVHRDVKPSNLIVTPDGQVKLVDMGLARLRDVESSDQDLTESGMTLGTFDYISPEQAQDPRVADIRSDLYSLGCSLFFMLTGQTPFPPGTAAQKLLQHANESPPDPRDFRKDVPDSLANVMFKMLAKDPELRYQTPLELIAALHGVADHERIDVYRSTISTPMSPPLRTPSFLVRQIPWVIPVCVMVIAIFAIGGFPWKAQSDSLSPWEQAMSVRAIAPSIEPQASPNTIESDPPPVLASDPIVIIEKDPRDRQPPIVEPSDIQDLAESNNIAHIPIPRTLPSKINEIRRIIVTSPGSISPRRDTMVCASLDEALAMTDLPNLREIELRTPALEINSPIVLDGKELSIVAGEDFVPVVRVFLKSPQSTSPATSDRDQFETDEGIRPTIEALTDVSDQNENGADDSIENRSVPTEEIAPRPIFQLTGGTLRLKGVILLLEGGLTSEPQVDAVFELSEAAHLELQDCWVRSETYLPTGEALTLIDVIAPMEMTPGMTQPSIGIRDCVIHGDLHLARSEIATPFEVDWSNGFFASSARFLELGGSIIPLAVDQVVSLRLDHVTASIEKGLVGFEATIAAPELIHVHIESTNCIYVGSRLHPLIEQIAYNVPVNRFEDFLDFRGRRNFYEETVFFWRQIVRDQGSLDPQTRSFSFSTWREYWRNEISSRLNVVQWQTRFANVPPHLLVPEDFALSTLPGNPAGPTLSVDRVSAGMIMDELPKMPRLSLEP